MNGRVYDPALARFMSADPTIQYPHDLQNYNRYSYVNNNPLMYADPSGYFKLKNLFKAAAVVAVVVFAPEFIGNAFLTSAANAAAASTTLTASTAFATAGIGLEAGALTTLGGIVTGATTGFAAGLIATGNIVSRTTQISPVV